MRELASFSGLVFSLGRTSWVGIMSVPRAGERMDSGLVISSLSCEPISNKKTVLNQEKNSIDFIPVGLILEP